MDKQIKSQKKKPNLHTETRDTECIVQVMRQDYKDS